LIANVGDELAAQGVGTREGMEYGPAPHPRSPSTDLPAVDTMCGVGHRQSRTPGCVPGSVSTVTSAELVPAFTVGTPLARRA